MPLTPFHLGPALLVGVLLYRWLDLPALLVGSVVVDVRAAMVVLGPLEGPVHGILTTFVGGTAVALVLGGATLALPRSIQSWLDRARLADTVSAGPVLAGAIVGVSSHVVLDSMLYAETRPFYPAGSNPFLLDGGGAALVYGGCALAGVLGVASFVFRYRRGRVTP